MTFWLSIKALLPSKIIQLFRFLFQIHILQISLWDFNNSALKIFNFFKLYAWFLLFNIFLLLLCFFLIHFCSLSLAFFQFRQLYHCSHSASFNMLLSLLFLPFFLPFSTFCSDLLPDCATFKNYTVLQISFFKFTFFKSLSSFFQPLKRPFLEMFFCIWNVFSSLSLLAYLFSAFDVILTPHSADNCTFYRL